MTVTERRDLMARVQGFIDAGRGDEAVVELGRVYLGAELGGDPAFFGAVLCKLGRAHFSLGGNDIALEYYLRALDLLADGADEDALAELYNCLGTLYGTMGDGEKALESKFKALEIARRLGIRRETSRALNNIGEEYRRKGIYNKAADYYRESLEEDLESGNLTYQAIARHNLAMVAEASGDLDGAAELYRKSLETSRAVGNAEQVVDTLMALSAARGDADGLRAALEQARAGGFVDLEHSCLEALVRACESRGDIHAAYGYLKQYADSAATLASTAQRQRLASVGLQHELEKSARKLEDLRLESEHLRLIIDTVPEYIHAIDDDGRFILANETFAGQFGVGPRQLIGRRVDEVAGGSKSGGPGAADRELGMEVIRNGVARVVPEEEKPRPDGTPGWFQTTLIPYRHPHWERPAVLCVSVDITERRRNEDLVRHMAEHDGLTGVSNRLAFLDRLGKALALARRNGSMLALYLLDLDGFKPVNDEHGHAVGDAVLRQTAARLVSAVRGSDTVGRIGGDEFVVFAQDIDGPEGAEAVAGQLRRALEAPFEVDGLSLCLSACVGWALFPDQAGDETALMRLADAAMYEAKRRRGSASGRP